MIYWIIHSFFCCCHFLPPPPPPLLLLLIRFVHFIRIISPHLWIYQKVSSVCAFQLAASLCVRILNCIQITEIYFHKFPIPFDFCVCTSFLFYQIACNERVSLTAKRTNGLYMRINRLCTQINNHTPIRCINTHFRVLCSSLLWNGDSLHW